MSTTTQKQMDLYKQGLDTTNTFSSWDDLIDRLGEAKDDPLAETHLLAPSSFTSLGVIRRVARESGTPVSGVTTNSVSGYLSDRLNTVAGDTYERLDHESLVVEHILRSHPDLFRDETSPWTPEDVPMNGLASSITSTIQDLLLHVPLDEAPSRMEDRVDGFRGQLLVEVLRKLKETNPGDDDQTALFSAQVPRVLMREEEDADLSESDELFLLFPERLRGTQVDYFSRLSEQQPDAIHAWSVRPNDEEDDRTPTGANHLEHLQNHFGRTGSATRADWNDGDASLSFQSAPDLHREAFTIGQEILNEIDPDSDDASFSSIGVVVPQSEDLKMYLDVFNSLGIPAFVPGGFPLQNFEVGQFFQSFLDLWRKNLRRDLVLDFVTHPLFDRSVFDGLVDELFDRYEVEEQYHDDLSNILLDNKYNNLITLEWETYSRDAGIDRGLDNWHQKLDVFEQDTLADRGKFHLKRRMNLEESEDDDGVPWKEKEAFRKLAFVHGMKELLASIEDVRNVADPGEQMRALVDLFNDWVIETGGRFGTTYDESTLRRNMPLRTLQSELDDVTEQVSWSHLDDGDDGTGPADDCLDRLKQVLDQSFGVGNGFEDGAVYLGSPQLVSGLSFKKLYVTGLNERVFPTIAREDPFLLDEERREESDDEHERTIRPLSHEGRQQQRQAFRSCVRAANDRLVLSYRRSSSESGTENVPSTFYLDALDAFQTDDGPARRHMEELVEEISIHLVSREEEQDGSAPATAYQHGLQHIEPSVRDAVRKGAELPEVIFDPVAHTSFYGHALANEWKRWGKKDWGPVDGVFTDDELIDSIRTQYVDTDPDVSSSNDYGHYLECPRKFLFERVLDLEEEDDGPEEQEEMDHLTLGTLVHGLLESLVDRLNDEFPQGNWNTEQAEDIARTIFEDYMEHYEKTKCTGLPLRWQAKQDDIWQMVLHALAEIESARENGWQPVETEWSTYERTMFEEVLTQHIQEQSGTEFAHGLRIEQAIDALLAELGTDPTVEHINASIPGGGTIDISMEDDALQEMHEDRQDSWNRRPVTLDVSDEEKVRFGGYVDRIDRRDGDEGFEFRVVDYKSGKDDSYEDQILANIEEESIKAHAQLPLYWLIVEEHEGENTVREAKYVFVKEGPESAIGIDADHWTGEQEDGLKQQFLQSLADWADCLDEGIFTTTSCCEYCSFTDICGGTSFREALASHKNDKQPSMERSQNGHPKWLELLDRLDNE